MGTHPEFDKRVIGWVNRLRSQGKHGMHTPTSSSHSTTPARDALTKSRAEPCPCAALPKSPAPRTGGRSAPHSRVHGYEVMAEICTSSPRRADISYYPIVGSGRRTPACFTTARTAGRCRTGSSSSSTRLRIRLIRLDVTARCPSAVATTAPARDLRGRAEGQKAAISKVPQARTGTSRTMRPCA